MPPLMGSGEGSRLTTLDSNMNFPYEYFRETPTGWSGCMFMGCGFAPGTILAVSRQAPRSVSWSLATCHLDLDKYDMIAGTCLSMRTCRIFLGSAPLSIATGSISTPPFIVLRMKSLLLSRLCFRTLNTMAVPSQNIHSLFGNGQRSCYGNLAGSGTKARETREMSPGPEVKVLKCT